jgi:hypothetical protein
MRNDSKLFGRLEQDNELEGTGPGLVPSSSFRFKMWLSCCHQAARARAREVTERIASAQTMARRAGIRSQ